MAFKVEVTPTGRYAPILKKRRKITVKEAVVKRTKSPETALRILDGYIAILEAEGYTIIDRDAYGNLCRRVSVYDYKRCPEAPAFICTITFSMR